MNEQHQQVYSNLIQRLLDCYSNDDEMQEILAANTDKLDDTFAQMLRLWATKNRAKITADTVGHIGNFGNLIRQFPLGYKASNIEIAITSYEIALTVYTHDAFPYEWAVAQNSLAVAYKNRIRGERAENLEQAIFCFQEALKVSTLDDFPVDWAMTQNNLANAYCDRIRGDRAENIEKAIACCQKALKIRTFDAFPYAWARTQNNLANAYCERIRGERAQNLEQAIACYQKALKVFTFKELPVDWAQIQNGLGTAYGDRIRGERAENIEKAIVCYQEALKVYTFESFPYEWARTQNNLGTTYNNRIRGKRAENLEQAITYYQKALKVRTFEAFPVDWAITLNNLAIAYNNRIGKERAEDFEQAITYCQKALKVFTFEASPVDWARTQNTLGEAYFYRIIGKRAENLEQAISCFQEALKVRTLDDFPVDWAITQNNLGNAYFYRIIGKRAENLEQAIFCYKEALKVYTFEAFPYEWAVTHYHLAIAYTYRIIGERAENLEQAISCFQEALKVRTLNDFPVDWAMTQNSLGEAYLYRIIGKRAENLEQAISCFQEALKVRTLNDFPVDWAMTQNNLANAYLYRIIGKRAENLEQAIFYYKEALKVRTLDNFRVDWAATQNNLAVAYLYRIIGERAENLEQAISCFQEALKVRTLDDFPVDWAATQNNLANAYCDRILGDKTENLEQAIAFFQKALTVRSFDTFPQDYVETSFNQGTAYQEVERLDCAYKTFKSAIEIVESLREEIVSGVESKRKQAEEWNKLYRSMIEVCLESDKITEAIEYVERSKTRNLVEQILSRDLKTIFPPEVVTQLKTYGDEIATGQAQIQNGKAENPKVLAQHLHELRQQRNELQNRYLRVRVGYGFQFDSFQATLDKRTAIIEWYILNEKILAFIVISTGETTVWQSQLEDLKALIDWANQYLQNYDNRKDQWKNSLGEELKKLASILHIDELLTQIPKHCDRLILIPHRFLHLFPLHALPVSENHQDSPRLLDLFASGVSYAPSCQILQQVQQRERPDFQSLFAIQNPTEDLDYADLEVDNILSLFPSDERVLLTYKQATKDTLLQRMSQLKEANCLHFSCHGSFNSNFPQDSCLKLAESVDEKNHLDLSKCLTLGNLFEREFQLDNCRLVVLSACETGLIDSNNTSDEYIGLPSGFLYAGSVSVVSSLWKVDDVSTALLIIRFYQNFQAGLTVAVALNQAQIWLRNATTAELQAWASKLQLALEEAKKIKASLDWFDSDEHPFQNPYWWAGFCAIGK